MKISYNWLQNYFEEKLPKPSVIEDGIIFHSFEVEDIEQVGDDTIFDIKVLPDRAHDCLSHYGVAKEISAIFDLKIKDKKFDKFETKNTNLNLEIKDDPELEQAQYGARKCFRYMGRIVRNVKVGESPEWLKEKLNIIGQKSINNIVDIANFVMFDLGQPIHCFDLDKLASEKIIVRNAKKGEKITTLDKKEIMLDESILVITDEKDPLAIAGIKGGTKAEVDMNTKNIIIEVANFNPTTTRKTAKKINILTDAVKRYENEISPELCPFAMDQVTSLIYDLTKGEIEDVVDIYPKKVEEKYIQITLPYINKRLGGEFSKEDIESVWKKLNFIYEELDGGYKIQIPYLRLDLNGPHDLTEEVIRILGYDKLPEKLPVIKKDKKVNNTFYKMLLARNKLLTDGYGEVMTYVFRNKGDIEVLASANGKNFLRNNLTDGLKESIELNQKNLPLLGLDEVKVFEIGTVFNKNKSTSAQGYGARKEEMRVAYGNKKNITEITLDEYCIKNDLLLGGVLDIRDLIKEREEKGFFKPWSPYPFIVRDIAVWVPEGIMPEKLIDIYKDFGTELLVVEPKLFDSFTKDKRTSFAYRLVFQAEDRTLTDEEINQIMSKITQKIQDSGFSVR